jgi:hypothetical protein
MELAVARLARKPLRVLLTVHRLSAALDADAALMTLRDFFDRSAKVRVLRNEPLLKVRVLRNEPLLKVRVSLMYVYIFS